MISIGKYPKSRIRDGHALFVMNHAGYSFEFEGPIVDLVMVLIHKRRCSGTVPLLAHEVRSAERERRKT